MGESSPDNLIIDRSRCDTCGLCAEACPAGARKIAGREMTVTQVLNEIMKDSPFYWNTRGGMTLSGGEPTMQPEFSLEILKACKEKSIHTAMETCCCVKWDILDEMLHYLDLVYIDIKQMSSTAHEALTTKSNTPILENIRRIRAKYPDSPVTLRVPVVPGINNYERISAKRRNSFVIWAGTTRLSFCRTIGSESPIMKC